MKRSKTIMIVIIVASILLISSLGIDIYSYWAVVTDKDVLIDTEYIGGNYDGRLEYWKSYHHGEWHDIYEIHYSIGKKDYYGVFFPEMRPALDWIKENSGENETIMCWWDYGHAIRGYTGRNVVIYAPSKSLENTIVDSSSITEWEDEEKVRRVAQALVATDTTETVSIMKEYNASYLVTAYRDSAGIGTAFFRAANLEPSDYVRPTNGVPRLEPTEAGRRTLIYRIWRGEDIPGLELTYSDIHTRVYVTSL